MDRKALLCERGTEFFYSVGKGRAELPIAVYKYISNHGHHDGNST